MKTIQVFEPAMCCSTGVCGPSVDPVLPQFTADMDWLKSQGVQVERYNLSQQPQAFASNAVVKAALEKLGIKCLPLVVVNDAIISRGVYPSRDQLAGWASLSSASEASKNSGVKKSSPKKSGCCGPSGCC